MRILIITIKHAIEKAKLDYNLAIKQNNTGLADKILGNLKSRLDELKYNWNPYALELLNDYL